MNLMLKKAGSTGLRYSCVVARKPQLTRIRDGCIAVFWISVSATVSKKSNVDDVCSNKEYGKPGNQWRWHKRHFETEEEAIKETARLKECVERLPIDKGGLFPLEQRETRGALQRCHLIHLRRRKVSKAASVG